MMCALKDVERQERVRVRLVCVPDEESEELDERATEGVVKRGLGGNFAITGEPTDLHIGVEAKGVLAMSIEVHGRAAHSSTPWLGDNAVLKAIDVFRTIETLPFSRESSEMFDRPVDQPRADHGRRRAQQGSRRVHDGGRHPLPARAGPRPRSSTQVESIPEIDVTRTFIWPPVSVSRSDPYVRALREAVGPLDPRRGDERGARRRVRRRLVPRRRHPGRRVRARSARGITGPRSGSR